MPSNIPYWLAQDIVWLKKYADITLLQVCPFTKQEANFYDITFKLIYHPTISRSCDKRIQNPEDICLRYPFSEFKSAPEILAVRKGFPTDLPHLNPRISTDNFPSICLWRNGTSNLYLQHGISNTVTVLQKWLADVYDGKLLDEGWEPYPAGNAFPVHAHLGTLQKLSLNPGKILHGAVRINKRHRYFRPFGVLEDEDYLTQETKLTSPICPKQIKKDANLKAENIRSFILICANNDSPSSAPLELIPSKPEDLYKILPQKNTEKVIRWLNNKNLFGKVKEKEILLLLSIRRPQKLLKTIPGIADGDAAYQEIVPFWVTKENDEWCFQLVSLVSKVSPSLLASVSGESRCFPDLNMIGCGAIGSAIAIALVRSGITIKTLFDSDILFPHNNARHECDTGTYTLPWLSKVILLSSKICAINNQTPPPEWFSSMSTSKKNTLSLTGHVIETVGDNSLETLWINNQDIPIHRVFIAHSGRVGILASQNKTFEISNADILDIEGILFLQALTNPIVENWLASDAMLSNRLLGFGCSSATMELSWSTVQHHCSALMPALKRSILDPDQKSQLVIHALTNEGTPAGYFEIPVPLFTHVDEIRDNLGKTWSVSYSNDIMEYITNLKQKATPKETGGYLFGLYNMEVRKITIVHATEAVQSGTPSKLTLLPIQNSRPTEEAMKKFNNMLVIIGTWHTHPRSSSSPSSLDNSTFNEVMEERDMPSLMFITGNDDPYIEIRLPKSWGEL